MYNLLSEAQLENASFDDLRVIFGTIFDEIINVLKKELALAKISPFRDYALESRVIDLMAGFEDMIEQTAADTEGQLKEAYINLFKSIVDMSETVLRINERKPLSPLSGI